MIRRIIIPIFCAVMSFGAVCGGGEPADYTLSITGYKGSFNGYYITDSGNPNYFEGEESYTDGLGNKYYDYEKDLPTFTSSVLVQTSKQVADSKVTARLWKDDKILKSVECIANETTTSGGTVYKMDLPELYYEISSTTTSTSK